MVRVNEVRIILTLLPTPVFLDSGDGSLLLCALFLLQSFTFRTTQLGLSRAASSSLLLLGFFFFLFFFLLLLLIVLFLFLFTL